MSNVGLYASHIFKINQRWNLTDGIRVGYSDLQARLYPTDFFRFPFDEIRQRNPVYSASVGMAFHPDRKLKLSGMISTGFRVPNIDDLAKIFDSSGGLLIVPNPTIKPEKTVNGEIGLYKILGNKIRIEFNTYVTLFTNALQVAPFLYEGQDSIEYDGSMSRVVAAQNLGTALIHGLSASMRYQVTDLLQLQLNGNYTKGRIHQNDITKPLDHIAPISIRCALLYQQRHFYAEAFSLFNGQKRLEDYSDSGEDNLVYATPVGMPAWYTLNMRAGYEINTAWMIQVGVDNILDTSYRVFASGINASGRNIYLTAKLKF
jgi:hemoglobin/transferrin/lactoferrin receptor protein